jgi:hypothetical protein
MMKKILALAFVITAALFHCDTVQNQACPGCLSPAIVLTVINTATNQKIIPSRLEVTYSNKDTTTVFSDSAISSGWCFLNRSDTTYDIYHGTGSYKILIDDSLYGRDSLDNISVADDNTICKRIFTRYFDVGLAPKGLAKTAGKRAIILHQQTKLGC